MATAEGAHWRVNLRPLGRKVLLSLQFVGASGKVEREGELLLNEIEETPTGAQRLVVSVLENRDVATTATVGTLVGEETRSQRKKDGELFFGLGLMGMAVPGTDMVPGGGLILRWSFETTDLGVLFDFRFAGGNPRQDSASMVVLGVGGRWFLGPGNWSPFLGTGLWFGNLQVREIDEFDGEKAGLGGWLEAGIEVLRLYESRLSFELRAEPAFFELSDNWFPKKSRYYFPTTFGITYMF